MDHSIKGLLLRVYFVLFNFFSLFATNLYTHIHIPSLSIVLDFVFIAVYFISIGYIFFHNSLCWICRNKCESVRLSQ